MSSHQIRKICVSVVILILAVGVIYSNFSPPQPGGLVSPGRSMPGMQTGGGGEVELVPGPLTYDIEGPYTGELVYPVSFDGDVRDLTQVGLQASELRPEFPSPINLGALASKAGDFVDPVAQTTHAPLVMPARHPSDVGGVVITPSLMMKMFSPEPSVTWPSWFSRIASS